MAHPQESYLAHGMSPQGSFSSPQTAIVLSMLPAYRVELFS